MDSPSGSRQSIRGLGSGMRKKCIVMSSRNLAHTVNNRINFTFRHASISHTGPMLWLLNATDNHVMSSIGERL